MIGGMSDLLRRHGPKVAVGGLVAVNVALVGALVLRDPVSSAVPAVPVPTSSTPSAGARTPLPPSSSPTAGPSRSPEPSRRPAADTARAGRLLAVSSGRVGWRAEATGCSEEAVVEVSGDGGRTWSPTRPGLTAVVRLKAYGEDSVFAVGADARCRPTYAWVTGPRDRWQRDRSRVGDVWFRAPDDLDLVTAPGGGESRPCGDDDLVDLAGLGTYQAAALCANGRIRTEAEGRSWRTVRENSGALSLGADDNGFVAAVGSPGCDGLGIRRFDSSGKGLRREDGTCRDEIEVGDQPVAVSPSGQRTWVWAQDEVTVR